MEGGDVIEEEEENHVEEEKEEVHQHGVSNGLKSKKLSWKKLDSFNLEAGLFNSNEGPGSPRVIPYFLFLFLFSSLFLYLVVFCFSFSGGFL
jgi:hypothetical protein